MLRSQEKVFLDDRTVEQIEEALQIKIVIVESDGRSLVAAVCGLSAPDWREKEHNR
jgi:NifB/MoaA-like Fe-S oxidoreductase